MTKSLIEEVSKVPGWILLWYLFYSQGFPAINYDWGIEMGTQDSADAVTEVGVAFWKAFAVADLYVYIPLLGIGLLARKSAVGKLYLAAALGITLYWPIVCLLAAVYARDAPGWKINERPYWIVLPIIVLWGLLSLQSLVDEDLPRNVDKHKSHWLDQACLSFHEAFKTTMI